MLCINNTGVDPYFNIASEEYLLKNSSDNIFMLWQNEPSVIVGRHQNILAEINFDFAKNNNLKIVRRFSGGGTVFHDLGNLNLTFIETNSNVDFSKFTSEIVSILAKLGITAQVDARRAINIDGLKISGSAQCIHKGRALFHATLLFSSNLESLVTTLESDQKIEDDENTRKRYVQSVKSPVTNISKFVPASFQINDLKKLIMDHFLEKNPDNMLYSFNNEDKHAIEVLKDEKYSTNEWNFNSFKIRL